MGCYKIMGGFEGKDNRFVLDPRLDRKPIWGFKEGYHVIRVTRNIYGFTVPPFCIMGIMVISENSASLKAGVNKK